VEFTPNKKIWEGTKVLVASVQFAPFDHSEHTKSLISFMASCHQILQHIVMARDPMMPLDYRRSVIADQVMTSPDNFTHLFMYDTDMEIKVEHIEKLLSRKVPCVSGTYFKGACEDDGKRQFPCVASKDHAHIRRGEIATAAREDALIEVDFTGCGCLLVTKELLLKMGQPVFTDTWRIAGQSLQFQGEDVYFADQVRRCGEKVYIDPTVIPLHFKELFVGFDLYDAGLNRFYIPNY